MNQALCFLLVPKHARSAWRAWRSDPVVAEVDDHVLIAWADPRRARVAFDILRDLPLVHPIPPAKAASEVVSTIELRRQVTRWDEVLPGQERRRQARAGTRGRRGARPVPPIQRWEVDLFALEGTEAELLLRAAHRLIQDGLEPIKGIWRPPRRRRHVRPAP